MIGLQIAVQLMTRFHSVDSATWTLIFDLGVYPMPHPMGKTPMVKMVKTGVHHMMTRAARTDMDVFTNIVLHMRTSKYTALSYLGNG